MKPLVTVTLVVVGSALAAPDLFAAPESEATTKSRTASRVDRILREMEESARPTTSPTPQRLTPPPPPDRSDLGEWYREWQQAYVKCQVVELEHRQLVFAWQLWSAKATFFVVLFLVFAGLVFSGIQFYKSLGADPSQSGGAVTELEASARGIRVSSPVLGVIVLVISFGFFYLYLTHVFPIEELPAAPKAEQMAPGKADATDAEEAKD